MDQRKERSSVPHVVIVGGGFAGLYTAKALKGRPVRVTVIDRRNYHLFQPLLYQVATAALSPADIAAPIRSILRRQANTTVLLAEATAINLAQRAVVLEDGNHLSYDYLVLATGARHFYFGHDAWEALAPGLKNLEDALEIRRRVLLAFEAAERATDPAMRTALLTFVVVGGGPTGVELAGALAEIAGHAMTRDFRSIDPTQARIILLEASPRILSTFPEALARRAVEDLEHLGVEVRTNTPVTGIEPDAVILADKRIATYTALWAAGVTASPLARTLGVPLDRAGRVVVEPDLTLKGHPEVFVLGDLATLNDPATGRPLPGVATVAIQQGGATAANIGRGCLGQPSEPFVYQDRGSMATIGRARAVATLGRTQLTGLTAWVIWLIVHIYFLIGFENRLLVLIQWAWAYFTRQRGARLITHETIVESHLTNAQARSQGGQRAIENGRTADP
ncbi:MAG: NAD(P)/FAD-dependent oxidoreductase [Candidatus Binatia bacterium]